MIRKSIGLALLVLAVLAFVVTSVTGSVTAAFDPFSPVHYYPYITAVSLPVTGTGSPADGGSVPGWLIPALVGTGAAAIGGYVALRLRSRRS